MFNVFDQLIAQSMAGNAAQQAQSGSVGGNMSDMTNAAIAKVRQSKQKDTKSQLQSDQKDVSKMYKDHNVALAARGEGPWAQDMNQGNAPEGYSGLNQDDAMNYHIMRRTYLDAKAQSDKEDSDQAAKDWQNHISEKYGMQGSIPGEGNK